MTLEAFPVGCRARCHGAHGDGRALNHCEQVWSRDIGALPCRVACPVLRGT
jgi:hypothetical protein